jgi:hypothetical protein
VFGGTSGTRAGAALQTGRAMSLRLFAGVLRIGTEAR